MAVTSGFLFGFEFLPVEVLRNCDHDAFPCNGEHMRLVGHDCYSHFVFCFRTGLRVSTICWNISM